MAKSWKLRRRVFLGTEQNLRSYDVRKFLNLAAVISTVGLSACDNNNSNLERAIIGGAIGCAAGEVLVDGRCVEGAAVGAGVGVLTN